jgi:hypothetical protein
MKASAIVILAAFSAASPAIAGKHVCPKYKCDQVRPMLVQTRAGIGLQSWLPSGFTTYIRKLTSKLIKWGAPQKQAKNAG